VSAADRLDRPAAVEAPPSPPELFRAVNERIRELAGTWQGTYDFICECEDEECMRSLPLTEPEYRSLREQPGLYAVLPGHEQDGAEIVARSERFVLVRATGERPAAAG
jgi:hypothetical protein